MNHRSILTAVILGGCALVIAACGGGAAGTALPSSGSGTTTAPQSKIALAFKGTTTVSFVLASATPDTAVLV
jgi:ABC-type glycerol-3-phosphate transport system substrate-binding protein